MYRNKKTGIIGVIITIIVLVVIVIISNIKIEDFSHIGGALSSFVMPVQNGITYIKNKFSGNSTFFSDLATIKEENKTLKERNSELEKSLRELEVIKSENDAGLVGHIISVTDTTAKVQTLLDTSSAVSSVVGTARDSVIIKGNLENSNMLKGTYIPTSAALLEGDKVETSGLGGIYPKGITIGTVKQIIETKNLTNRYILVEPAVNFDKLETVLVIIK